MASNDTKKIVVIKDIKSNLIEEAIFILRREPKRSGDYILKEAQAIIDQYIKENGLNVTGKRGKVKKGLGPMLSANLVINILLASSFVILLLLLAQLILL